MSPLERRLRPSTALNIVPNIVPNTQNARLKSPTGSPPWLEGLPRAELPAATAASWIVITVGAPAVPGVTVGGLKVAVAPAGSPEAESVTTLLNAPPKGGTVRLILTEPPGATGTGVVGPVTV